MIFIGFIMNSLEFELAVAFHALHHMAQSY